MRISVIIPNYNYGAFIGGTIQSVLNQTESVDEIIVIDDGSADNSREVIESFGTKIQPIFQKNSGQAAAISAGVARATGDIIFLLDSDDFFVPNKCQLIKKIYQDNEFAQWVFHDLNEVESKVIPALSSVTIDPTKAIKIDQRHAMEQGKISYDAPATSGLSFRASFIKNLFPLPTAQSIFISDHYIKFYCIAMGSGLHISQDLGGQLIHGNNLYTGQKQTATRGKIFVNTAYALREICPQTSVFCNSLFAEGRACVNATQSTAAVQPIIDTYQKDLSLLGLLFIELKTYTKTLRYQEILNKKSPR